MTEGVKVVRDSLVPNVKQARFFRECDDPDAEEIMFSGSIRAGKTQACVKKIVGDAWRYGGVGWRAGVFRRTYRELEDSTKAVFLRGDGGLDRSLPAELVREVRVKDDMVVLKNGAEILFRSLENPREAAEKIRNVTFGAMFIDQIEELDGPGYGELYETMISRLSDPRGPGKMYAAANPGSTTHWAYLRFHPDSRDRLPETRYVHVTLHDNREYLDPKYYARQMRQKDRNPEWYARFIMGEWGAFGGKRFDKFRPDKPNNPWVIDPFEIPKHWDNIEGIDYGYAHATVWLSVAQDHYGLFYATAEHYESKKSVSHHAAEIRRLRDEHNIPPSVTYLDPSAWAMQRAEFQSVAAEFADHGIDVAKAQNDRLGGWNRLEEFLDVCVPDPYEEGVPFAERTLVPRLRFLRGRCPELLRELPNLRIKDGTDDVEKKDDHASDALRYVLMSREAPPLPHEEEEETESRGDAYAARRLERARGREDAELYIG